MEMKKYKLGDILELQRGYDLTSAEMKNANIPVAGSNGVIGYHDVAKCITPCITVGRSGSVGKVHFYRDPVWVHNTALYVSNFKGNDPKYLYYLLSVLKLDVLCGSSVVPSLNRNVVYPMEVPFCSDVGLQNKISSILSTLDQRIENLRAQNRVLEQTAKTIYDYTFLQCAGRQTAYNKTLNRNIPEDWEVKNIFDVFDNGFPFSTELFTEEITDKPVVRIRDILEHTTSAYTTEIVDEKYRLQEGDLVIGMDGNFHMNLWTDNISYLNQRCVRIRMNDNNVTSVQAKFALAPYIKAKEMTAKGSTVGHLSDKDLKGMFILVPDSKTLKNFNAQVLPIFQKQLVNTKQIEALTTQRNTLLPLLMTGQVEV